MKKKKVVSEVKIFNVGDLLISNWLLKSGNNGDGSYNFDTIFKYVEDYIKDYDLSVINLETSYGGDKFPYSAFPKFNTPDEMLYAAYEAGFNVFLTASNHAYDLGYDALVRRIDILEKKGLKYLGTRKNINDSFHRVIFLNNIKIGMLNYTRETTFSTKDKIILNAPRDKKTGEREYIVVDDKAKEMISSYNPNYLDKFYLKLDNDIKSLKNDGAEVIIAYMHWGKEYDISIRNNEKEIAKKMSHLGVDVIVGSHPHVVQPVKNYISKISGKTTLCVHSLGNFVSSMNSSLKVNNVEYVKDGALLGFTIKKYEDGSIVIDDANILPSWVYIDDLKKHFVIPLDKKNKHDKFNQESYDRTFKLVNKGILEFNKLPKIVKQSESVKVKIGDKVQFFVDAIGKGIRYRWQYSYDKKKWKTVWISSKINIKINKNHKDRYYRCVLKNSFGTVYTKKIKISVE